MGILRFTGKVITTVINIRADHWIGAKYLQQSIGQTAKLAKNLFSPEVATYNETFEESMQRLAITEADLKSKENQFLRLFAIHLLLALAIFCYCLFLFFNGNWGGGLMTLCLVLYPLALAFRFHFWLFQIRRRKLNCTIQEWWYNK